MQEEKRANVVLVGMTRPPAHRRPYRFTVGAIKYKLKYFKKGVWDWELSFRAGSGISIRIRMDSSMRPKSIKVNGFTWTWNRYVRSRHWHWIPENEELDKGLPDKIAAIVSAALADLKPVADSLYEAHREAEAQACRQQIEHAERKWENQVNRQRRHLKDVLEQI